MRSTSSSVLRTNNTLLGAERILLMTLTEYGTVSPGAVTGQRTKHALYLRFQFSRIIYARRKNKWSTSGLTSCILCAPYLNSGHNWWWPVSWMRWISNRIPKSAPHLFRSSCFCSAYYAYQSAATTIIERWENEKFEPRPVDHLPCAIDRFRIRWICGQSLLDTRWQ